MRERSRDIIYFGSLLMYVILVICGIYLERLHNKQAYLNLLADRYKLIAPQAAAGNSFEKWQRNGVDYATTSQVTLTLAADRLVVLAQGEVFIEALPGGGTSFLVRTPRRFVRAVDAMFKVSTIGGRMEVESMPGSGSRFRLVAPVTYAPPPEGQTVQAPAKRARKAAPGKKAK